MSVTARTEEIARPERVIKPTSGWAALHLGEVWEYRELLYFLIWRDVKVRYKQAVLGVLWAVLQPVLTMVVFNLVFNKMLQVPYESEDGVPYVIFAYAGLLPWQLFAGSLSRSGTSLVGNAGLLTKIYFPRLIIPLSAVVAGLVDFAISFVVFVCLMVGYGIPFGWEVIVLPALVVLALCTALAFGLWLSALNVLYRDVAYVIPFLVQLWMFLSPVAYSPDSLSETQQIIYGLNPMAGVIQGFRWALLGGEPPSALLAVSIVMVLILLVTGLMYFKRMERTFADVV
jgi:lipopolysaccharide transport system permease protein